MYIIPSGDHRQQTPADSLTSDDVDLLDLLALHVICGTLREARR